MDNKERIGGDFFAKLLADNPQRQFGLQTHDFYKSKLVAGQSLGGQISTCPHCGQKMPN